MGRRRCDQWRKHRTAAAMRVVAGRAAAEVGAATWVGEVMGPVVRELGAGGVAVREMGAGVEALRRNQ